MEVLTVKTSKRDQFVDITQDIARVVANSKVVQGVCFVCIPHTTAGITINENADPDVVADLLYLLDSKVPWRDEHYLHGEGNTAAHLKASLMGTSVAIPIEEGRLVLGTWQSVYFCEFDGPRMRRVFCQLLA